MSTVVYGVVRTSKKPYEQVLNIPKEIQESLDRLALGNASAEDVSRVHDWLNADPVSGKADLMTSYLQHADVQESSSPQSVPPDWENIIQQILSSDKIDRYDPDMEMPSAPPAGRLRPIFSTSWRYAAAVVVLLAGVSAYYFFRPAAPKNQQALVLPSLQSDDILPGADKALLTLSDGKKIQLGNNSDAVIHDSGLSIKNENGELSYSGQEKVVFNTMTTPQGGQYKLTLADGTRVWLNAASSVTYPTAFNGNERDVKITGEVYFEVAGDASKPFRVETEGTTIEVLGTHFNVNAYADEASLKTTLITGSVKVVKGTSAVMLDPGQQAIVRDGIRVEKDADTDQAIAWTKGFFNFQHKGISEVMRELARWYNVDVKYQGNMDEVEFRGEIGRNLSLKQVLNGLEGIEDLHFTLDGNVLTVRR